MKQPSISEIIREEVKAEIAQRDKNQPYTPKDYTPKLRQDMNQAWNHKEWNRRKMMLPKI